MGSLVSVGLDVNNNLINVDLSTLKVSNSPMGIDDVKFNEIRYLELSKRNKLIYTVLYIVYSNIDEKDIVGYVVSDNYGNISLLTLNNLCKLIESYPCMSYYLITKNNKYFIRKYHNLEIATIKDSDLKSIYGYCFGDTMLRDNMTVKELDFCMSSHGFKLGYAVEFKPSCYHLIYFNVDGYQIIVDLKENSLRYYGSWLVMMHHVDSNKYANFIRNYSYYVSNTLSVDGINTDILISSHGKPSNYFKIVDCSLSYSKPCIPYYLSETCDGDFEMLHLSPGQRDLIDKYFEGDKWGNSAKSTSKYSLSLKNFASSYIRYKNIFKYSDELQSFYINYKTNYLTYLKNLYIKHYGFTMEQLDSAISEIDKLKL